MSTMAFPPTGRKRSLLATTLDVAPERGGGGVDDVDGIDVELLPGCLRCVGGGVACFCVALRVCALLVCGLLFLALLCALAALCGFACRLCAVGLGMRACVAVRFVG